MLRRFNSLIKGPKGQSDEECAEQVSLRPARSVDSSLLAAPRRGGGGTAGSLNTLNTLNPLRVRRAEDGQTSLTHGPSRPFAMGHVPEERSWKEGYERTSLDSPGTPVEQYEPGEKPVPGGPAPVPAPRLPELPRIPRTASDAVVPIPRTASVPIPRTASVPISRTVSDAVVDIPDTCSGVDLQELRKCVAITTGPGRTISSWSTDSAAEHCRICQQHSEEPLVELGCLCRGDMAKSHQSCIEMWFKNKGTNKCEVCQHVASNIPAPATSPMPHFWVWRLGGQPGTAQGAVAAPTGANRVGFQSGMMVNRPVLLMIIKKHPLIPVMWISLLAFMTYLFVDAINTATIGYAAMPIGFLFGILVVLGLGTAVRLIMECCHERAVERSIRQMELLSIVPEPAPAVAEESTVQSRPDLPV